MNLKCVLQRTFCFIFQNPFLCDDKETGFASQRKRLGEFPNIPPNPLTGGRVSQYIALNSTGQKNRFPSRATFHASTLLASTKVREAFYYLPSPQGNQGLHDEIWQFELLSQAGFRPSTLCGRPKNSPRRCKSGAPMKQALPQNNPSPYPAGEKRNFHAIYSLQWAN